MRHRPSPRRILTACAVIGVLALVAFGCSQEDASTPETMTVAEPDESPAEVVEQGASEEKYGIAAMDDFIAEQSVDKTDPQWKTRLPKPPQVSFDDKTYYWELDTNVGKIRIRLMPETAPMHASSTIYLTQLGFYDGLLFHRVIPSFMAQGGDPLGNGRGNPGYRYDGEFSPDVKHDRPGLLSMANAGPGTDGSQFFLTFVPTPHLDGRHTIFGEVVEGMEAVKTMEAWRQRGSDRLNEPLVIQKAEVRAE